MATYSRREVTTTRVEFLVPARWPEGTCWTEMAKAVNAAVREMRDAGMLAEGAEPSGDAIRVVPGDDELIVSYEIRSAVAEGGAR